MTKPQGTARFPTLVVSFSTVIDAEHSPVPDIARNWSRILIVVCLDDFPAAQRRKHKSNLKLVSKLNRAMLVELEAKSSEAGVEQREQAGT